MKWGASKQAVTLNDGKGQGNNIAVIPTYVQGICTQMDLWRTSPELYKNKRFADAIAIWSDPWPIIDSACLLRTSNAFIFESKCRHIFRAIDISQIDDNRCHHIAFDAHQIQRAKLPPLSHDDQSVDSVSA
jgi:hypothetical protein